MPSVSEKQRLFMGAELARKREGKKTQTGMNEQQLKEVLRDKNPRIIRINDGAYVKDGCRVFGGIVSHSAYMNGGTCWTCRVDNFNNKREEVLILRKNWKSYKETSKALWIPAYLIPNWLFERTKTRYRAKKFLPKKCEICGFDRVVEIAHIKAVSDGGENDIKNLVSMCPNCHRLHDSGKLNSEEIKKLDEIVRKRKGG